MASHDSVVLTVRDRSMASAAARGNGWASHVVGWRAVTCSSRGCKKSADSAGETSSSRPLPALGSTAHNHLPCRATHRELLGSPYLASALHRLSGGRAAQERTQENSNSPTLELRPWAVRVRVRESCGMGCRGSWCSRGRWRERLQRTLERALDVPGHGSTHAANLSWTSRTMRDSGITGAFKNGTVKCTAAICAAPPASR